MARVISATGPWSGRLETRRTSGRPFPGKSSFLQTDGGNAASRDGELAAVAHTAPSSAETARGEVKEPTRLEAPVLGSMRYTLSVISFVAHTASAPKATLFTQVSS